MFKHLFKLIWNKKKQNFLLMTEMLVSFMVLFAVFTLMVYYYDNYKKPMGFKYQDVWVINISNAYQTKNTDSLDLYYETLRKIIKALPQVQELSFVSGNTPFSQQINEGGLTYKGKHIEHLNNFTGEDSYKDALQVEVLEGRWFNKQDAVSKYRSVVIDADLKEATFGKGQAVGKLLGNDDDKNKMKVVGVIQTIKRNGDYVKPGPGIYYRADTGSFRWLNKILVRVSPGADAAFEGRLYKTMANYMKNSNIEIEHLTNKLKDTNYFAVIPMIILSIVSCFLIINVALGLFGVLWYNINKRKGEIGLRRAIGATGNSVSSQLVMESMILATLSLIIGSFFAIQFPLLNVFNLQAHIYIIGMLLSIIFVYLLVLVCSLYPGRQAAAIYPAVALHEE
ncbi:ABC transporter permease [Mucilaginibacter dorajii]|uniref:FtsX-like permease family protein n=1 Tax=Mucilaginibacter dorajii TaxID=692994 RepID=A0ABP7P2K3_9SPHI|nr:ABC transporter permease [Mucilaginibacter dorajii]MCS3736989.1 putative ABC transport system permease protein [Mucilaginibacter dorajii]